MTDDRDLDQLLGRLAEAGRDRPDPAEHPSDGTLSFYHARKLSPEEEDRVRDHLVECKRCRDLLLEYAEFMEDEEEETPAGVADFGAAADWQRLRGRIGEDGKELDVPSSIPTRSREERRSWKAAYPLAAVLAAGIIGLTVYIWSDRKSGTTAQEYEPVLLSATVRGDRRGQLSLAPEEKRDIQFSAEATGLAVYPKYRLRVFDANGREISSSDSLERTESEFRFALPSDLFVPGLYDFRIFGEGKGDPHLLEQYPFRFKRDPANRSGTNN